MTDMLHKPNGWDEPLNQMTDDEWKEYFRLRKELDVEMTDEDIDNLIQKVTDLYISEKKDESAELALKIPLDPLFACSYKLFLGLKEIQRFNLSLAKKEFPGEF